MGQVALGGRWIRADSRPAAHVIAYVKAGHELALRSRPSGPLVARVGATTPFGSRRALGVVTVRRGRWLGVTEAGLGNNRLGWVDARAGGVRYARTRLQLVVDLSDRTLVVRAGSSVLRQMTVGVGRPGSPTPTGRFSVTDKLHGPSFSTYYGCCILALSATQPNLPAGWTGGNRIAIHGTPSTGSLGDAVSAGCLHAGEADLRYLMRILRLGTPVVIRR
jgi:L,D-transpeptidase catalytic domain